MIRSRAAMFLLAGVLLVQSGVRAEPWRFSVIADTQGIDGTGTNSEVLRELAVAIAAEGVEVAMVAGDLVVDRQEDHMRFWIQTFKEPLEAHGIAVYPCRGNHDMNDAHWNAAFSGPHLLPQNGPDTEKNITYSVDHRNARFIALETPRNNQPSMPWLTTQLAQNDQVHTFVFSHYPVFRFNPPVGTEFWDALSAAGVRMYFCGHWHLFDRGHDPDLHSNTVDHIIVGTGGGGIDTTTWTYPWAGFVSASRVFQHGYLLATVEGVDVSAVFKQRVSPGVYEAVPGSAFSYRQPGWAPECALAVDTGISPDGLEVAFTDQSTPGAAPITHWLWDFGDGETSSDQNPSHTYAAHGRYTVTLTVTNPYDSSTESVTIYTDGPDVPLTGVLAPLCLGLVLLGSAVIRKRGRAAGSTRCPARTA